VGAHSGGRFLRISLFFSSDLALEDVPREKRVKCGRFLGGAKNTPAKTSYDVKVGF